MPISGNPPATVDPFVLLACPRISEIDLLEPRRLKAGDASEYSFGVVLLCVLECVADGVLDRGERCLGGEVRLFFESRGDLLHDSVFALAAELQAGQVPVRVLGLDPAHGRGDDLVLGLPDLPAA